MWVIDRRYDKIGKIGKGGNGEGIASHYTIYAPNCISLKDKDLTSA
jgi:hypothetical protein